MLGDIRTSAGGQGLNPAPRLRGTVPTAQLRQWRTGAWAALTAVVVLLPGCGSLESGSDVQLDRVPPEVYVVRAGDTLFSIAARFHLDYREVARWNRLGDGSLIYPGQRLQLRVPAGAKEAGAASPGDEPKVAAPARWLWPTEGEVVLGFRQSPRTASGVLIGGKTGQAVVATADGEVVYSGSGLPGYGQLVIIRHNAMWLSAYGHNEQLLVREGDRVRAGDQIARMGGGAGYPGALHFEIRRNGEPVNPLLLLTQR